jgi:plasmid maintenance system killer protein
MKFYDNRILDIHNIGSLIYTNKGDLIEYPERLECDLAVKERLNYWREKLEKIIISATSEQIARITRYSNFWNPINFIISSIVYNEKVHKEDFQKSKPRNIMRYLQLLEHLDLINQKENIYDFTPEVSLKYDALQDDEKLKEWILSILIEKRYKIIRDVFNITQLTPLIKTENVYYIPSLNADELLYKSLDSLTRYYAEWYDNKVSKLDVQYWLRDLVKVDVMQYEDDYYFGNDKMFKKMMDQKDTVSNRLPEIPI